MNLFVRINAYTYIHFFEIILSIIINSLLNGKYGFWRFISHNKNYLISSEGYVASTYCRGQKMPSIKYIRLLKADICKLGYCRVHLTQDNRRTRLIHRLVAKEFLSTPYNLDVLLFDVHHINNIALDNRLSNLQYVSHKKNIHFIHKEIPQSEILSKQQVITLLQEPSTKIKIQKSNLNEIIVVIKYH